MLSRKYLKDGEEGALGTWALVALLVGLLLQRLLRRK
jgi:hypothetical protein